ncbi:DNA-binding protein HEXBP-like [Cynara cardunculus var. scolymus]|uniref:DNA-binding protein HEXBP-like n=1 Tax=Cynara cardunculus var. scolymus TaxID=59895 RepID=UPI000D62355A|nr:DNA-binding protein HEXBP-like [Cynara cardunculus var. scolymus]
MRKVNRFVDGLKRELRRLVGMSKPTTFQDAVELATLAEKDSYVPDASKKRKINQAGTEKFKRTQVVGGKSGAITACATCGRNHPGECRYGKGVCFTCGKPWHMSRECKARPICYSCGDPGHRQRECSKKNTEPPRLLGGSSGKKPDAPKGKG